MNEPTPTVIVVRPRSQALDWVARLKAAGQPARALPLIDILPAPEPAAVARAFAELARAEQPVAVFVSPNAVEGFFAATTPATWPARAAAAATGPGTVAALRAAGVADDRIVAPLPTATQFDSEALWQRLEHWSWVDRPVWIVRGNGGRDWLGDQLRAAGARVRVVQSYARAQPSLGPAERAFLAQALERPHRFVWLFSSSEAIGHLATLAPGADWRSARALATHPRIAERARDAGFGQVGVVPPQPQSVVDLLRG